MVWHVEMHEVYSSVCSFRGEGEDQGRIWIRVVKSGRAPGLDHEPLRDDLECRTGERGIEGLEWRTRLDADRDRRVRLVLIGSLSHPEFLRQPKGTVSSEKAFDQERISLTAALRLTLRRSSGGQCEPWPSPAAKRKPDR